MHCPNCENEAPDRATLCPHCGVTIAGSEPSSPRRPNGSENPSAGPTENGSSLPMTPFLLWGLAFVLVLVISVGTGAYVGLRRGREDRALRLEREATEHYETGLERLDEGNYELAKAEFEHVLKLEPGHPQAQQGLAEAGARLNVEPTATAQPEEPVAEELYEEAQAHFEAERWQEAASVLTSLGQLDPTFRPEDVEDMLFESRYRAGMALLEENDFELGIYFLDRAVALRPLDEEATTERRLANQYVEALSYWGADWEACIAHFEDLYRTAPEYKDVFQRLYRAHVRYAEAWQSQGEMCPAVEQYEEALRLLTSSDVEERREDAAEVCRSATPTPVPTIEGSRPVTRTTLPPGFNVGRLAYPVYDTSSGQWDVYALFADGRLLQMAAGADQPVWMWQGDALGYRDRTSAGIRILPSLGAAPERVEGGAGLAWPTFSADGQRMAYAERDAAGEWQILVGPTDGSSELERHASGWGPAWGPTGLLAWTGCEPDNGEACGIFIDNPEDDQPGQRVSGNANDIALSWSPGGNKLAYMSDHTGNWEIYTYDMGGGFQMLTDDPAADGLPAWSPDGSAIAFVSDRDGGWGIYLMRPGGEDPRPVISLGPNYPNWTQQRLSWAP